MARYIIGKSQIKRLLEGKSIQDIHGRNYCAGGNLKEVLQKLDEYNLYDKYEVIFENGEIDIVKKEN